ncbi:hypothetical protein [Natronomonas sp.]|uniref:hypothetical protein n=1 Tax=Natronomonas sp. TaxID=2184060 RepID=UPI003976D914
MPSNRRTLLRRTAAGLIAAFAGCLGRNGPDDGGNGDDPDDGVDASETIPFVTHTTSPWWHGEDDIGRVILVDDSERQRAVLGRYDLSESRREDLRAFLSGIDYETERLLSVESVGPNACHDELEIDSVRVGNDDLLADAVVVDSSDGSTGCAEVITFPSSLARVAFDSAPPDEATVELTDGWGETATVRATSDDPIGPDLDSLDGVVRPDGDPEPIAALECDEEGVERHYSGFDSDDLAWGTVERDDDPILALRIDHPDYEYGDEARVRLTNVADRPIETGNDAKYNLQAYTEAGWQDVRVSDENRPFAYTDEAIGHAPGDGFEWSFGLTEDGIEATSTHDHARVCPDLQSGRYRFVFWGVIGGSAAVGFDLRR